MEKMRGKMMGSMRSDSAAVPGSKTKKKGMRGGKMKDSMTMPKMPMKVPPMAPRRKMPNGG